MSDLMIRALPAFALLTLVACLWSVGWPKPADGAPLVQTKPADAQRPAPPRRIGVLLVAVLPDSKEVQAFRQALAEAGYVEGQDVVFELRSAQGDYNRVPELAAELVQIKVDVILADSTPSALAAKRATSAIPIVIAVAGDPIRSGLAASLARPGGNVTGLSTMTAELGTKRLQLLKEMIPRLSRVAVLWNPTTPWHTTAIAQLKVAAASMSLDLTFVGARTGEELDLAFSAVKHADAQALLLLGGPPFWTHRTALLTMALKARLPAIYGVRSFADEGGLLSYGPNFSDMYRRSAGYVDKILRGAQPAELPIEEPTQFELIVNLRTANALGIKIPEAILFRADEVLR